MTELQRFVFGLVLGSILPFIVTAIMTGSRDFSATARRTRRLEEQNKIVAFWDSWIKVDALLSVPNSKRYELNTAVMMLEAYEELHRAGRNVLQIYREEEFEHATEFPLAYLEFHKYRKTLPWYRRAFLLYKAPNPMARRAKRGLFFSSLVGGTIGTFLAVFHQPKTISAITTTFMYRHLVLAAIGGFIYIFLLLWMARRFIVKFENDPEFFPRSEVSIGRSRIE